MDFQLNNETYFIDPGAEEGQWFVFAQTPTGIRRIPVYVDQQTTSGFPLLVEDKKRRKIVN